MSVILIMLPAALLLAAIAVGAFIWAARRGQFDDLDTPPIRAVFDDETGAGPSSNREQPNAGAQGAAAKPGGDRGPEGIGGA